MKNIVKIIFTLVLFGSTTNVYCQYTYTITSGPKWQDATIHKYEGNLNTANTNYVNFPRISATAWTASGSRTFYRNLLKFDLSDIPAGTIVLEAVLIFNSDPAVTSSSAYNGNSQLSGSNAFYLERVINSWNQSTVTWNNQPSTTTTGRVWVEPSETSTENIEFDVTKHLQYWVDNPTLNYGLLMKLENEVYYRARNYASTNHSNSALHPKLRITLLTEGGISECGTRQLDSLEVISQEWFGNNQHLIDFMNTPEYSGNQPGNNYRLVNALYKVPINIYAYRKDNGVTTSLDFELWELERIVRETNLLFAPYGIQFYLNCNINMVHDTQFYDVTSWPDAIVESTKIMKRYHTKGYINVHFVGDAEFTGRALTPNVLHGKYSCIVRSQDGNGNRRSLTAVSRTLAHEIGHVLNLDHTHDSRGKFSSYNAKAGNCLQEPVNDRTQLLPCSWTGFRKCEINGDRLCDTSADPGLSFKDIINYIPCNSYINNTGKSNWDTDNWGTVWNPDLNNLMGYGGTCRNAFSPMQVVVMNKSIHKFFDKYNYVETNIDLDSFEPNNYTQNSTLIEYGQSLYSTFHWEPSDNGYQNMNACDVDWYTFSLTSTKPVAISTKAIDGENVPNTFITLYDQNFNVLTTNDDTPNSSLSEISTTLSAGTYYVQVQEISSYPALATKGHYYFSVSPPYEIIGDSEICQNEQKSYSISNLSSGTVEWSTTNNASIVSCKYCNSVVIKGEANGSATLTAAINNSYGTTIITKDIIVKGLPTLEDPKLNGDTYFQSFLCKWDEHSISITPKLASNVCVTWTYPNLNYIIPEEFCNTFNFQISPNNYDYVNPFTITASASNSCGTTNFDFIFYAYDYNCSSMTASLSVYPNPATNEVTIENSDPNSQYNSSYIEQVELYDDNGNLKQVYNGHPQYNKNKMLINLRGLKDGNYIFKIIINGTPIMHHLIINN